MSELKEHLFVPGSELQEGAELTDVFTLAKPYYLKSEADLEIRKQKRKRCLALAKWCWEKSLWWYRQGYLYKDKEKLYDKWNARWLAIADELKEA